MGQSNQTNSYTDFFYHFFRNILVATLPLLIISALVLSLPRSSANSSGSDNLAITISSSCTLSSVVNIPHNAEVYNGNHLGNIGKTTITTLCNDGNGYAVYANGFSNNEEGNNKLINSSYPQYNIDTGLATSGLTSTWAMKLNNIPDDPSPTPPTIESNYNNIYGLVPTQWTKVASRASGTTDMDEGSSFTTTYAVYASSNQHAGSYLGQVKYLLTHPSTKPVYYFMQDVADWKDTELPNVGDSLQAIDSRDGKKYWVTRLADGNIWMTQNLDFDINSNTTLNSNNTDLNVLYNSATEQYTEYNTGYTENNGVIYWTPASTATTINFTNNGPISGWGNDNTKPYSANKTDDTNTGHTLLGNWYSWSASIASNNSSNLTNNTKSDITNNPKNSICPKGWRLPTVSNESGTSTNSSNEFDRLNVLYNEGKNSGTDADSGLLISPLWLTKSGYINPSGLNGLQTYGNYWSSTIRGAGNGYYLGFLSNSVAPAKDSGGYKYEGYPIRCLAR